MSRWLAIDTAGPVLGIGLWDGQVASERIVRVERGAEQHLPAWIDALCGGTLHDLAGIGVARGPGAFTGLRVGLAAAQGLAMALDIPVWPAPSLLPRAVHAGFGGTLLVMLDARKARVYGAQWQDDRAMEGPADVAPEVAIRWCTGPFRAAGEGALVYRSLVEEAGGTVVAQADHPGTSALARLTADAIARGEGIDPTTLRPEYLRASG